MVSQQETQRPLLTPGEVMQLPPGDALILLASTPPILAGKLRYYTDANFTARVGGLVVPEGELIAQPAPSAAAAAPQACAPPAGGHDQVRAVSPEAEAAPGEAAARGADEARGAGRTSSVRDQIARYYLGLDGDREP